MIERRTFLSSGVLLGGGTLLSGCCTNISSSQVGQCPDPLPEMLTPGEAISATDESQLVVDIHTHVFNAHDVPMEEYFTRPVLHLPPVIADLVKVLLNISGFAPLLRGLAPCASDEFRDLCELTGMKSDPSSLGGVESRVRAKMQTGDQHFVSEMMPFVNDDSFRAAYRRAQNIERQNQLAPALREDDPMTEDEIIAYLSSSKDELGIRSRVSGIWRFLRNIASPRHQNAFRLMDIYATNPSAPVDLFVTSTLDFDASLNPRRKSTPLLAQARIMQLIAEMTDYRIMPCIGYDPRRDEATDGAALANVKEAITDMKHVGVKLYPVMGFAPLGNASLDGRKLCEWPSDPDYGRKLDARLKALFEYTIDQGVPLLAHSSDSMGITADCQVNGDARSWNNAFVEYPDLRVCAGHFGGLSGSGEGISDRMRGFVELMGARANQNFYVDLSFLPSVFDSDSDLGRAFAVLLHLPAGSGTVADHVMLGTDWYMIAQDAREATYVADVSEYLESIGGAALRDKILRDNPTAYLNLSDYIKRNFQADPLALSDPYTPKWADKLAQ